MRTTLVITTVLDVIGVAASFLLFALASQVFGLSHELIRTVIHLKLSMAGQLTILVPRTQSPSWTRPASVRLLLGAVATAQPGSGRTRWSGPASTTGASSPPSAGLSLIYGTPRHPPCSRHDQLDRRGRLDGGHSLPRRGGPHAGPGHPSGHRLREGKRHASELVPAPSPIPGPGQPADETEREASAIKMAAGDGDVGLGRGGPMALACTAPGGCSERRPVT